MPKQINFHSHMAFSMERNMKSMKIMNITCEKDRTLINWDGRYKMEVTEAAISKPHTVSLNFMVYLK